MEPSKRVKKQELIAKASGLVVKMNTLRELAESKEASIAWLKELCTQLAEYEELLHRN